MNIPLVFDVSRWLVVALLLALGGLMAGPAQAAPLIYIEEPAHGSVVSGVGNLRGWALGDDITQIEYSLDGHPMGVIPYGGTRHDVQAQYPAVPGSGNSGFSMAFNYGNLGPGPHVLLIEAGDTALESRFEVASFEQPFVTGNPEVYGEKVWPCGFYGICLEGIWFPGEPEPRDLELQWSSAAQQFVIVANEPHQDEPPPTDPCGFSPPAPGC